MGIGELLARFFTEIQKQAYTDGFEPPRSSEFTFEMDPKTYVMMKKLIETDRGLRFKPEFDGYSVIKTITPYGEVIVQFKVDEKHLRTHTLDALGYAAKEIIKPKKEPKPEKPEFSFIEELEKL